jgi:hypothetical protein
MANVATPSSLILSLKAAGTISEWPPESEPRDGDNLLSFGDASDGDLLSHSQLSLSERKFSFIHLPTLILTMMKAYHSEPSFQSMSLSSVPAHVLIETAFSSSSNVSSVDTNNLRGSKRKKHSERGELTAAQEVEKNRHEPAIPLNDKETVKRAYFTVYHAEFLINNWSESTPRRSMDDAFDAVIKPQVIDMVGEHVHNSLSCK